MKKQPEYALQTQVCNYLRLKYKTVLFMSDTVASLKLTQAQAIRNKAIQKPNFKTPDLIIFHPKKQYNGMFLELKVATPYLKDGHTPKTEHIAGQLKTIQDLRYLGYYANFGVGFEDCKKQIDLYFNH
jgi:hypothetical protein